MSVNWFLGVLCVYFFVCVMSHHKILHKIWGLGNLCQLWGYLRKLSEGGLMGFFFFREKQPTPWYSRLQIKISILTAVNGDEGFCLIRTVTRTADIVYLVGAKSSYSSEKIKGISGLHEHTRSQKGLILLFVLGIGSLAFSRFWYGVRNSWSCA